jgi:tetratricopeptide (TPR) repeat protein
LANESKFSEAKLKLNEALGIKADVIITAKLKEIEDKEKQLAAGSKLEKEYQDLLAAAEGLETSKDYDGAIQKYKEASAKKPAEKFPKDKIAAIEVLKLQNAKQKEVDAKYDAAMKRGDELMTQQKYLDAIKEYNNALAVKPNETLPVQKAKEAEDAEKSKGSEDRKQYEKIIGGIEKAITEKDYSRGKELVERAKSFNKQFNIFPSDTRPNDLLTQINLLEQADKNYTAKITEGEKMVAAKEYAKALAAFEAAKIIKPSETLPQTRIEEIKKLMAADASAQEKERMYSEYMTQGGLNQNAKNYEKALENYQSAIAIKPGDKIAQDKISEIKQLMDDLANSAKSAQERKEKFNALIKEADALFSGKSYAEASLKYSEALGIDAKSSYAKKQLDESNRLKAGADALKLEEEFKALVKSGDDFFAIKSFDKSKEDFNKALALKPGNPYVVNKLKEIDAFLNPATEKSLALQPLGTPYESSIMDGYAALKEAEIKRKNMKDGAVENKVSESVKASADLEDIQEIKAQSNREKVTNAVSTVSANDQNADLNRQLTVQVLDKTQKEIENEQYADENFKHSENIRSQESLTTVIDESAIDYKSREDVYSENSEIVSSYNAKYMEAERQREVGEGNVNVAASQKISEIEKNRQSDAIDDYASRDEARKEVDQKRKQVTELDQTLDQDKKGELLENDRQLYNSKATLSAKEVEDAKVAPNNDGYLKQVKSEVVNEESGRSDEQVVRSQELNKSIDNINVSIDQNNVERDMNRAKTTEVIKQGTEEMELTGIATNKKENTKYQSNKSVIDGKGSVVSEAESEAKENLSQNNMGVKLLDKKANTTASELNLSDDEERLATRKKVEIISGDIEQNSKASEGEQAKFSEKVDDVTKAVEAGNIGLEEANKNKNLSNQEKLTEAETKKPEKIKLANSLGQEYPEGVSQESFTQNDSKGLMTAIITRRIVVIEGRGDVYVRTQTLQAITYTKNGQPITETVWQRETQGPHLKKNY